MLFSNVLEGQRSENVNVGMSFEYSSSLWLLPLVTSVVLLLVFGLTLTATYVYIRRRRNQSTVKRLASGGSDKTQDDRSLVFPVPGSVVSSGFPEEMAQLAEQPHPVCGTGYVDRCCLENCGQLARKNWANDRRSMQNSSRNSFYLLAPSG